jgi:hypothetical protein
MPINRGCYPRGRAGCVYSVGMTEYCRSLCVVRLEIAGNILEGWFAVLEGIYPEVVAVLILWRAVESDKDRLLKHH